MTQATLLQFFGGRPHPKQIKIEHSGDWTPPEYIRIPGVRFAPEVPHEKCEKCPYSAYGHPLVYDPVKSKESGVETDQLLCTKDCLKAGIPLKRDEKSQYFELEENAFRLPREKAKMNEKRG